MKGEVKCGNCPGCTDVIPTLDVFVNGRSFLLFGVCKILDAQCTKIYYNKLKLTNNISSIFLLKIIMPGISADEV